MTLVQPSPTARHDSKSYRLNAKTWARKFNARLLEPGLVSYQDAGCGMALLRKETLDRCINSFVGRPVVCRVNSRGRYVHEKTSPGNMKAVGHGYITDVYYNDADGWYYGKGVVDTDEAADAIAKIGFGSVGYKVNDAGPGGSWHNVKYDEEIKEFSGEHLAIVSNPRYEDATIRLNSKNNAPMSMFKWIKKQIASRENAGGDDAAKAAEAAKKAADAKAAADAEAQRQNSANPEEIDGSTELEIADGKKVTIAQLVEAYNAKGEEGGEIPADATIHVNGKEVPLSELVAAHTKLNATESDDDEAKKKEEAAEKKKRENAAPAKAGRAHFKVLLNARDDAATKVRTNSPSFGTREEKLALGQELYGSAKPGKN